MKELRLKEQVLKNHKLPKLSHDEIDNLNSAVSSFTINF